MLPGDLLGGLPTDEKAAGACVNEASTALVKAMALIHQQRRTFNQEAQGHRQPAMPVPLALNVLPAALLPLVTLQPAPPRLVG